MIDMTALTVGNIQFAPDHGRTTGLDGRDTQRTRLRPVSRLRSARTDHSNIGIDRGQAGIRMGSEWLTSVPKFCWEKKQMKDSTDITIILDRSGSMRSVQADTIGGYNTFIDEQKKIDKPATISLIQFDDQYETVYAGKDIKDAPELNGETFQPRGMTALLDAIGKTINATGKRFKDLPDGERPQNVVIAILTDGDENASIEFTSGAIAKMILLQQNTYNWQFVFVGANQDAILTAQGLGIHRQNAMTYAANAVGTRSVTSSLSANIGNYRMTGTAAELAFDATDVAAQAEALGQPGGMKRA